MLAKRNFVFNCYINNAYSRPLTNIVASNLVKHPYPKTIILLDGVFDDPLLVAIGKDSNRAFYINCNLVSIM